VDEQKMNQQEQIQEAVSQAVRDAMREFVSKMPEGGQNSGVKEQVDKIYAEVADQIEKQKEMMEKMNDVQSRLDQQAETSLRLAGAESTALDPTAFQQNVSEFKQSIELCSQTMDQLRKQLNRERSNNDRTITELYRSMKYSEERIEELHANYDEFTTVIQSHKSVMGLLVWLNIVTIIALVVLSIMQLFK
jgi:ABC-type transporter Mla subunit MlaD